MINPFTIQSRISHLQQEVLEPLYTMHSQQESVDYDWLLVLTGRVVERNRAFLEELAESRLVATAFTIVKLLGGAENLTQDDFARFTSYINDGGIMAMVKMLLAADKEKAFLAELALLPQRVRRDASEMLTKSKMLHHEFVAEFFKQQYGSMQATPPKLLDNYKRSNDFIHRLATLAKR